MKKIFSFFVTCMLIVNSVIFVEAMDTVFNPKVSLIGSPNVGKTAICIRLYKDEYIGDCYQSTIGAAFAKVTLQDSDGSHKVIDLWDTAGQERYKSLVPIYVRDTDIAIIVFSLTDNDDDILKQVMEAKASIESHSINNNLKFIFVGNKSDLSNSPDYDSLKQRIAPNDPLVLTSALNGTGIDSLKRQVLLCLKDIESKATSTDVSLIIQKYKKKCC